MADRGAVAEAEALAEKPYDTADPQQVNSARKRSARKDRERINFVAAVMESKEGRAWMWGMLTRCRVFDNAFVPGQPDATGFKLGERNVGLFLLQDVMRAAPDAYSIMAKEAAES